MFSHMIFWAPLFFNDNCQSTIIFLAGNVHEISLKTHASAAVLHTILPLVSHYDEYLAVNALEQWFHTVLREIT